MPGSYESKEVIVKAFQSWCNTYMKQPDEEAKDEKAKVCRGRFSWDNITHIALFKD
jgi:hypothetical protein